MWHSKKPAHKRRIIERHQLKAWNNNWIPLHFHLLVFARTHARNMLFWVQIQTYGLEQTMCGVILPTNLFHHFANTSFLNRLWVCKCLMCVCVFLIAVALIPTKIIMQNSSNSIVRTDRETLLAGCWNWVQQKIIELKQSMERNCSEIVAHVFVRTA